MVNKALIWPLILGKYDVSVGEEKNIGGYADMHPVVWRSLNRDLFIPNTVYTNFMCISIVMLIQSCRVASCSLYSSMSFNCVRVLGIQEFD